MVISPPEPFAPPPIPAPVPLEWPLAITIPPFIFILPPEPRSPPPIPAHLPEPLADSLPTLASSALSITSLTPLGTCIPAP